jgi:catechol 2,3-dioxygenase-like lactoylglutathione lyase family enzyme
MTLITLGVADVAAATEFYERFGLRKSSASQETVSFFQLGPVVLGLFEREALTQDGNAAAVWTGNGGITLARNLGSEAEVDRLMTHAEAIGAVILKPAQRAFWGGYHGYFADPEGHLWEVAHNPHFPLSPDGKPTLPD